MPGREGRSGRRPKPLADHLLNGTFRPHRHAQRLAVAGSIPAGPVHDWQPSDATVAELGEAGRRFLTAMLAAFTFTIPEGVLLVEAAHALDGLATWRPQAATDRQAARLTLAHSKQLSALLAQLRIR